MGDKDHGSSEIVKGLEDVHEAFSMVAALAKRFDSFLEDYEKRNRELIDLNREVIELNKTLLAELRKLVEHIASERSRTGLLRSIPRAQAKEEILRLFKDSKKTPFYSDIAEELGLDLELVVELCNELEKEGQIGMLAPYETKGSKAKPN